MKRVATACTTDTTPESAPNQSETTILLIEHEPAMREYTRSALEEAQASVVAMSAVSVCYAELLALRRHLTLVILAADLPQGASEQLLKFIRFVTPEVPVILTGSGSNLENDWSMKCATALLKKPYTPKELLACVNYILF